MPQYEMGIRDYWRILRKRKLAVILTCLAAGGLTWFLTQHVFRSPPTFSVSSEVSVSAPGLVGFRPIRHINIAQEAKLCKSEMLLRIVLWGIEQHPVYAIDPSLVLPPAEEPKDGRRELTQKILGAMTPKPGTADPTKRMASTAELAYLFVQPAAVTAVENIVTAAEKQEEALRATRKGSPAERAEALKGIRRSDFLYTDKDMREEIVAQLQDRMEAEWDTATGSFKIKIETTAPGFGVEDQKRASDAAVHITETIATVYKAYTEWEGRRAVMREIERIDAEKAEREAERDDLKAKKRAKQDERLEAEKAERALAEARAERDAANEHLHLLRGYLTGKGGLTEYTKKYDALKAEIDAGKEPDQTLDPIPSPPSVGDANILELYRTYVRDIEPRKIKDLKVFKKTSRHIRGLDEEIGFVAKRLEMVVQGLVKVKEAKVQEAENRIQVAEPTAEEAARLRDKISELDQEIGHVLRNITGLENRRSQLSLFKEQGVKVDIIERPGVPEEVGRARAVAKTAVGALIGLVLGVVIAVLWETFDLTIGTIEEVESFLETRVLGVVPHVEADRLAAEIRARDPDGETESSDAELQQRAMLVTLYDSKSVSAEAFRHIRTTLDFARTQHKAEANVFLVTSATLYEGKTIVAANLAVVTAQNGKRVCLVECDLRRPQLHRVFGLERTPGLYDVFIGKMGWQEARKSLSDFLLGKIGMEAAVAAPGLENLSVITCGTVPPNPVELLGSAEMGRLFQELREAYDVVVVDSPPILPVADAAVISPFVDGAILVYRAGSAPRTILSRAKTQLESVDTHLFGVVLNDLRPAAGEISATYPYKRYVRKAYALPEDQAAPRVHAATSTDMAADRGVQSIEEMAVRRADLLLSQGKVEEAVKVAYEASRAQPQSVAIRLELAKAYVAGGRVGEAQAELIHVLDMDPRNLPAVERLADMALDAGLDSEALRWYEEILEFAPDNAKARARADEIRDRLDQSGPDTV